MSDTIDASGGPKLRGGARVNFENDEEQAEDLEEEPPPCVSDVEELTKDLELDSPLVEEIDGDNGDVEQVMEDLGLPDTEVPWMEFCKVMLRLNGMPSKDLFVSRPSEPEKLLALRERDAQELLESGGDLLGSPLPSP